MMEGRAMGGGSNLKSMLLGRERIKRENRSNGGQDRMEGNIVSLTQHNYYGSHLQNYTDMPSKGNGWGGRDEEKLELNVLGTTVKYCSCHWGIRNTGKGV